MVNVLESTTRQAGTDAAGRCDCALAVPATRRRSSAGPASRTLLCTWLSVSPNPTAGSLRCRARARAGSTEALAGIGFVAQDYPHSRRRHRAARGEPERPVQRGRRPHPAQRPRHPRSTQGRRPLPVAHTPRWRSPSRSPRHPSCCSWTSRWPGSTRCIARVPRHAHAPGRPRTGPVRSAVLTRRLRARAGLRLPGAARRGVRAGRRGPWSDLLAGHRVLTGPAVAARGGRLARAAPLADERTALHPAGRTTDQLRGLGLCRSRPRARALPGPRVARRASSRRSLTLTGIPTVASAPAPGPGCSDWSRSTAAWDRSLLGTGLPMHRDWSRLDLDGCPGSDRPRLRGLRYGLFPVARGRRGPSCRLFYLPPPSWPSASSVHRSSRGELDRARFGSAWTQGRGPVGAWSRRQAAPARRAVGPCWRWPSRPRSPGGSDPEYGLMGLPSGQAYEVAGVIFAARPTGASASCSARRRRTGPAGWARRGLAVRAVAATAHRGTGRGPREHPVRPAAGLDRQQLVPGPRRPPQPGPAHRVFRRATGSGTDTFSPRG